MTDACSSCAYSLVEDITFKEKPHINILNNNISAFFKIKDNILEVLGSYENTYYSLYDLSKILDKDFYYLLKIVRDKHQILYTDLLNNLDIDAEDYAEDYVDEDEEYNNIFVTEIGLFDILTKKINIKRHVWRAFVEEIFPAIKKINFRLYENIIKSSNDKDSKYNCQVM